jgi:hypothetical protein
LKHWIKRWLGFEAVALLGSSESRNGSHWLPFFYLAK